MSVDIFFDLRGVHGELGLAAGCGASPMTPPEGKVEFAKLLVEAAGVGRARHRIFRAPAREPGPHRSEAHRTVRNRFRPRARCRSAITCSNASTSARLRGVRGSADWRREPIWTGLIDAQAVFLDLILSQQLFDIHAGQPATNAVSVRRLAAAGSRTPDDRIAIRAPS